MNDQIIKISDVIEDIKENMTDSQYKIIMDSLMIINNSHFLDNNLEKRIEEINFRLTKIEDKIITMFIKDFQV